MDANLISESRDYLIAPANCQPLHVILIQVCRKYNVAPTDMLSRRRPRLIAWPRHEFYWRARNETSASLPEIGRFIGNRDHTTVMYGIRRHEERMAKAQHDLT